MLSVLLNIAAAGVGGTPGLPRTAALFGRSGRPLTKAPDLNVGDVTKGQDCSFLARLGGKGRDSSN